jgi:HPt (histidine-containing phosphotransfer) domain-containing protein
MDAQMPEMDGLEATRCIRERWPDAVRPCIVAVTANAMHEDREACLQAGMDDYVSKPVRAKELQAALVRSSQWVQARAARNRDAQSTSDGETAESTAESGGENITADVVLDPTNLRELRSMADDGMPEIWSDLLEAFRADSLPLLDVMREAVESGDALGLKKAAHGIKGAAANLGGSQLAALCGELEKMGRESTLEGAAELLPLVEAQYHRLCAALQHEILNRR